MSGKKITLMVPLMKKHYAHNNKSSMSGMSGITCLYTQTIKEKIPYQDIDIGLTRLQKNSDLMYLYYIPHTRARGGVIPLIPLIPLMSVGE